MRTTFGMRSSLGKSSVLFIVVSFLVSLAAVGGLFLQSKFAEASPFTFTQTSWTGGATATTAVHASNQTGWTQYSASSGVTAGANVALTSTNYAFTDDGATSTAPVSTIAKGGGFTNGTNSTTTVSGTGVSASVRLASSGGTATTYATGVLPQYVAFDSFTSSVWISESENEAFLKMNINTGTSVGGLINLGLPQYGVAFDSSTNSVWLTNNSSFGSVSKITAATTNLVASYPVGASPRGVAFDSFTNSIWVANNGGGTVTKLTAATGAVVSTYPGYTLPEGIVFDSFTNSVWVTNSGLRTVSKVNVSTGAKVDYTVSPLGSTPFGIAYDSLTHSVWVTNSNGTVSKVDVTAGTVTGTYTVGLTPLGVAFDSFTNSIWVANSGDNTVSKLSTSGTPIGTYATGLSPTGIAYDSITHSVWIANNGDNTMNKMTVISAYAASGVFTSAVIDTGAVSAFSTIAYTTTVPANTALTVDVRAGNTAVPDGTWTAWTTNVLTGGSIALETGNRYFQYRANLSSTNTAATPTLNDVTINYSQYPTSGTLTSSIFNSGSANNSVVKLTWVATGATAPATLKFQVRSSADGVVWSNWCGPSVVCAGADYFLAADSGVALVAGHPLNTGGNDQYFQAQAFLGGDGSVTPTVSSVAVGYDTGAAGTPAPAPRSSGGGAPGLPIITNVSTSTTTCTIPFSWDMSGTAAPNLYNATRGAQYTTATSGSNMLFPIIYGKNIVQARDGLTVLKSMIVECSYAL